MVALGRVRLTVVVFMRWAHLSPKAAYSAAARGPRPRAAAQVPAHRLAPVDGRRGRFGLAHSIPRVLQIPPGKGGTRQTRRVRGPQ